MSQISKSQIQHVAELAKIQVSDKESEVLSQKLSGILELVEKMQSINTDQVEAMSHALYQNQKLRVDHAVTFNERDRYQKLSQETDNGFYIVPKVIE
jgi:aspartyl-tRNA(Asn)/glutamyl-tRNA(Gln) amidotransferase subunit C